MYSVAKCYDHRYRWLMTRALCFLGRNVSKLKANENSSIETFSAISRDFKYLLSALGRDESDIVFTYRGSYK